MLLREAYDYWLHKKPRNAGTALTYRYGVERTIALGFTDTELFTRETVVAAQNLLLSMGRKVTGIRSQFANVRAVLAELEEDGLFPTGRLAEIRKAALDPPRQERWHRVRHLSRAEVEHLAATAARVEPRMELPIRVASLAGPRTSELGRMRAEDRCGGFFVIETRPEWGPEGTTKTGPRSVPVCAELRALFEERLPRTGWLFPSGLVPTGAQPRTPFMTRRVLERGIKRVRRAAGMADDITFTVLRHSRASWWLQGKPPAGGASIYKVADWLGHSVAVCETYYGSLVDGYDPECERAPAA